MAILKHIASKVATTKPYVLANDNLDLFRNLDGKSLVELDAIMEIKSIEVVNSTNEIPALVLEFKDKKVAFPFSRGLSNDFGEVKEYMKEEDSAYGIFRVRRKRAKDAQGQIKPGEDELPTGPEFIAFGKPSGLTYKDVEVIYSEESVPAGN